ncbi:MAG: AraC family transcriptional regulator [Bacteroidota bacterium]
MPIQFLSSVATESFIATEIPESCQPFLISRAEPVYFKNPSCSYLLQKISGTHLNMNKYRFFVNRQTKLYAVSKEPLIALIFILSGSNTGELKGYGPVDWKEGYCYLFYIPPHLKHEVKLDEGTYRVISVHLSSLLASSFFQQINPLNELIDLFQKSADSGKMHFAVPFPLSAIGILQTIMESDEKKDTWDIYLLSKITELFFLYYKETELPSRTYIKGLKKNYDLAYMEKIIKAKLEIDKNKGKPLSLAEVTQKAILNEKDLKSGFKAIFGESVYAYQMEKRLEKGRRLLMDTSLPIEIISKELGYEDPPSFANEFKKYFGMPPTKYRQNIS